MKLKNIIDCLNDFIEHKRIESEIKAKGHLIIHKQIEPDPTFKIYKTFRLTIWFIHGKNKYKVETFEEKLKAPSDREDDVFNTFSNKLLFNIFNSIDSEKFKQIIEGTYNGN